MNTLSPRNIPCPSCGKRRDVRYRPTTFDYRCKCGMVFPKAQRVVVIMNDGGMMREIRDEVEA